MTCADLSVGQPFRQFTYLYLCPCLSRCLPVCFVVVVVSSPVIDPTDPVVKPLAEQYDKACTAATDCLVQGPITLTCDSTDDKCKVVRGSMLGGDPCSRDEDCNSAKCEANRCKGIADGETCSLSAQCMSTSYCKASNNKCEAKLDAGVSSHPNQTAP